MPAPLLLAIADHSEGAMGIDLLIVLATAGLVAVLAQRLRIETVPAYLIAGAVIGPSALGVIPSPDRLTAIGDLAIILLMFGIGLHMDLASFRAGLKTMIVAGLLSYIATTIVGWPVAMLLGLSPPAALAASMALSLSSTAVVLRILSVRRTTRRPFGRLSFAILVLQDLIVIGVLAVIPALADWHAAGGPDAEGPGLAIGPLLGSLALKAVGVALIIIMGRWILPRVLHEAARGQSREVMLVLAAAAALGAAIATGFIGLSPELGAFLAGLMLASTPLRHQLAGQIGPLRDLLIAVFFTVVGMRVNMDALVDWWWLVLIGAAAMIALKSSLIGLACWASGAAAATSVSTGLMLAQAGEFSLVVLAVAHNDALVGDVALANLTAITAVSLVVTPLLISLGERLGARAAGLPPAPWISTVGFSPGEHDDHEAPEAHPEAAAPTGPALRLRHVVIAGFGVVGRAVAERFDTIGVPYTIIEFNPAAVRRQRDLGRSVVYGDVANVEVLESAHVRHADAVILTIPDEDAVLRACSAVRSLAPDAFIAARTNFLSKGMIASRLGADAVTVEEIATAEAMAHEVIVKLTDRAIAAASRESVAARSDEKPHERPAQQS